MLVELLWHPGGGIAQSSTDPGQGYTLSLRSQIVQLDVVVRNQSGELVRGLKADDFQVAEGGRPQKILSVESTSTDTARHASISIHSTAELDRLEPAAAVTVIVLDELSSSFQEQYFAEYSLEKYLGKQGETLDQPTTLIARRVDRTIVLSDYTTSKQAILNALKRHAGISDPRSDNANYSDVQTGAALASLIEIAHATEGHPGHKNVVWIGRGLPSLQWHDLQATVQDKMRAEVQKCVNLLESARITLYSIDPAGVEGVSGTLDDAGMITLDDPFSDAISFDALAKATGGLSMHGRNDVDRLISDAAADGENFYTLTYRPSSVVEGDPKNFRSIKISLMDPSLTATSREGYYPAGVQGPAPAFADEKGKLTSNTMFDLASASTGLMVFDAISLTLSRGDPAAKEVQVSFPASSLGLTVADGKLKGDVTLIALTFNSKGKLLTKDGRVVSLHLDPLADGQAESRTIHLTTAIDPRLPAARLRVVVRANANGKVGAENLYLSDRDAQQNPKVGSKPTK